MLRRATGVGVVVCCVLATVAVAQQDRSASGLSVSAAGQINRLQQEKASRSKAEQKLDTEILFALKRLRKDPLFDELPDLRTGRTLAASGELEVEIHGNVGPVLQTAVAAVGSVLSAHPGRSTMRARVPLGRILALAERLDVRHISRALPLELRKDNTSQGDVAHRADLARANLGVDGSGVTIGVMSDGVDTLAARQATGDLPATVNIVSGQGGSGDEGTAMLEIVYDLAPGATLWFATALGGEAQFATNIAALQAAGCDIIVDDVFYYAEGTFQDDVVAAAVNTFTDAGGLYFSSAGNSGNLNDATSGVWQGDFVSAASDPPALAGDDTHDFGAGSTNTITVDSPSYFILQWSDPLLGSSNDYDLYLLNAAGTSVFDSGANFQTGTQDPFEFVDSIAFNDTGTKLAIVRYSGSNRFLWLNTNRGQLAQATSGQTSGHSTANAAFGVAASNGTGGVFDASDPVETFSSDGPRRMFFEADGTPYTAGNFSSTGGIERAQPKITGADGVATAAPGFNPFFGTSAAAPHVAAITALILENADLTPAGLEQLFSQTAVDIEGAGFDRDSGHGILNALAVVNTTLPSGLGGNEPDCAIEDLALTGDPNDGPQTFRACNSITASNGQFDDLTLIAHDTSSDTPGVVVLNPGFGTSGPLAIRTVTP